MKKTIMAAGLVLLATSAFSANQIKPGQGNAPSKREPVVFTQYNPSMKGGKSVQGIPGFFTFFYNEPRQNDQEKETGYRPMPKMEGCPGGSKPGPILIPLPSERTILKKASYEYNALSQPMHRFVARSGL